MTTQPGTEAAGGRPTSFLLRAASIVLFTNAAVETIPAVGFVFGFVPHAEEHPVLARRVASCMVAGVFMLLFVAMRLRRDLRLIALPITYLFCHLVDSVYEYASSGQGKDLAPAGFEAAFLTIYVVAGISGLRSGRPRPVDIAGI